MRLYTFTNLYLSSIQKGIQSAHVTSELFSKYHCYTHFAARFELMDWAQNHKTMIVLNGGNQCNLREIETLLNREENPYPWSSFYEDEQSLNNCLTCVGIVVPEPIYSIKLEEELKYFMTTTKTRDVHIDDADVMNFLNRKYSINLTPFDVLLMMLIQSKSLAI